VLGSSYGDGRIRIKTGGSDHEVSPKDCLKTEVRERYLTIDIFSARGIGGGGGGKGGGGGEGCWS